MISGLINDLVQVIGISLSNSAFPPAEKSALDRREFCHNYVTRHC